MSTDIGTVPAVKQGDVILNADVDPTSAIETALDPPTDTNETALINQSLNISEPQDPILTTPNNVWNSAATDGSTQYLGFDIQTERYVQQLQGEQMIRLEIETFEYWEGQRDLPDHFIGNFHSGGEEVHVNYAINTNMGSDDFVGTGDVLADVVRACDTFYNNQPLSQFQIGDGKMHTWFMGNLTSNRDTNTMHSDEWLSKAIAVVRGWNIKLQNTWEHRAIKSGGRYFWDVPLMCPHNMTNTPLKKGTALSVRLGIKQCQIIRNFCKYIPVLIEKIEVSGTDFNDVEVSKQTYAYGICEIVTSSDAGLISRPYIWTPILKIDPQVAEMEMQTELIAEGKSQVSRYIPFYDEREFAYNAYYNKERSTVADNYSNEQTLEWSGVSEYCPPYVVAYRKLCMKKYMHFNQSSGARAMQIAPDPTKTGFGGLPAVFSPNVATGATNVVNPITAESRPTMVCGGYTGVGLYTVTTTIGSQERKNKEKTLPTMNRITYDAGQQWSDNLQTAKSIAQLYRRNALPKNLLPHADTNTNIPTYMVNQTDDIPFQNMNSEMRLTEWAEGELLKDYKGSLIFTQAPEVLGDMPPREKSRLSIKLRVVDTFQLKHDDSDISGGIGVLIPVQPRTKGEYSTIHWPSLQIYDSVFERNDPSTGVEQSSKITLLGEKPFLVTIPSEDSGVSNPTAQEIDITKTIWAGS